MAYIMDRGGNMWDSETGGLVRSGHTPMAPPHMPTSGPVVTSPPTPAKYEDVSRIETIKELRTLVHELKLSEPVGDVYGLFPHEDGTAYMDIPRHYLSLSEAKQMARTLELHGFKLVKVVK